MKDRLSPAGTCVAALWHTIPPQAGSASTNYFIGNTEAAKAVTLSDLADLWGADLEGDGSRVVRGPASLAEATPEDVSFLGDGRYLNQLRETRAAGVLVVAALLAARLPNCVTAEIAGAGHMLPITHPDAVAKELRRFLEVT